MKFGVACPFGAAATALEKLTREDVERQLALNRALMDARVFKVQSNQFANENIPE